MKKILYLIPLIFIALNITANEKKPLPGDTSLPSSVEEFAELAAFDDQNNKYSVEDFFRNFKKSNLRLSPDGKYLSYMQREDSGEVAFYLENISTKEVKRIENINNSYNWFNDKYIYYTADQDGDEVHHLYLVNIDTLEETDATPFEGVRVVIDAPVREENAIMVRMNKDNKAIPEPYKVDITTGEIEKLFELKDAYVNDDPYYYDKNGELRAYKVIPEGEVMSVFYYKDLATGEFYPVQKSEWYEKFKIIDFDYSTENKNDAYILSNVNSDKAKIYLYDFKKKRVIREVFSNDTYDVEGILFGKDSEIHAFSYEGEKRKFVPVSSTFKKIHKDLTKRFKGKVFKFISVTENEKKWLFKIYSDKIKGKYVQYDAEKGELQELVTLKPYLQEEDMATMKPIRFKSRDGYTIHGYLTLPKNASKKNQVPLIVNPHGGPQGVRNLWTFISELQLFASRGFATLQVNFRISSGYGKDFIKLGIKQVGRKIMDDIEDGVKHVIETGVIDEDKIVIYGASHGGYATLMGLVKTSSLYKAAIDYVGVSNIFTFRESMPAYWKPLINIINDVWYDLDDPVEAKIAEEVSPLYQIDKIQVPLLVIQGANDPRVNINESDQIVRALRDRGTEVPYMVKYDEGHGFYKEKNKIDAFKVTIGFLAKHLNIKY